MASQPNHRTNEQIRAPRVRLVGPDNEQVGVVETPVALALASDAELDLVEVAPTADPPVCKIINYSHFRYTLEQKAKEARKHQERTTIKEVKFKLKIEDHDYHTKSNQIERFLSHGDKVKVTLAFRGREASRPESGQRLLKRLADDLADHARVESTPRLDGRFMAMVLSPLKKPDAP